MVRRRWLWTGLIGGLVLLGVLLLGGRGVAAQPGGAAPAQGTPSVTSTRTAGPSVTPTATSGVCQALVERADTLCTPTSTYTYTFGFHVEGGFNPYANLTFYFEVASDPQGPWTPHDQQPWSGILPRGYSEVSGTFTEANIPAGYYYYRIRVQGVACNTIASTTNPTPICTRPTPTVTPNCATGWNIVASPNGGNVENILNGVAAAAPDDVWAVGLTGAYSYDAQTLIEHWNGSSWSLVAGPNPGTVDNHLSAVAARGANDVWAVGGQSSGGPEQTLTLHWDGAAWTVVSAPNPGTGDNVLNGVVALAVNDVWAVGYARTGTSGPMTALMIHWDGAAWTTVPGPASPYPFNNLLAVAASGPQDVWAVGRGDTGSSNPSTLIQHWNGGAWSIVPSPNPSPYDNWLNGVIAFGSADAWAVGTYFASNVGFQTLALHWDGSVWSVVPSPSAPTGYSYLNALAGTAADLWAGGFVDGGGTLVEHWNGSAWSIVASPSGGARGNVLRGLAAPGQYDVWAVGSYEDWDQTERTLAERYTGPCLSPTPSATATRTRTPPAIFDPTPPPATATFSPTPVYSPTPPHTATPRNTATPGGPTATFTPTATSTPLAPSFSDVHESDYFYEPVRYLASHGVISGYADGTFRPYNPTTRAQQVKIVVLGLALPPSTPAGGDYTFADVPPAQPFFTVVETAAAQGVVSGYGCGSPGEPCDARRRPYFRPNADVTRGQLAKMVVGAAGWPLLTPAVPSFADVAPGSAFYASIETAVCRGILSGYADGTYRPGASATRGQIAKIVYLAITAAPPCAPLRR